jgi:Secretion system C-terminal sorting domain/FG-GAP-like repeat
MKKILLSTSLCLIILNAYSQNYAFDHYNSGMDAVKVMEANKELKLAFAGGFDVPQFTECDLNLDGKLDLVVFDREGSRLNTFLNIGNANETKYEFAPQYISKFPKIVDWLIMNDYNGDGKKDIFTSIPGGFRVYKNISDDINGLKFQNTFPQILCDYTTLTTRLYVANTDIPAILDVDEDGDIDLLTFYQSIDTSGESIYFYKNMSMERYNVPDSMDFIVSKYCWGAFRESFTGCRINLQYPVGPCANGGRFVPNVSAEEFLENMNKRIINPSNGTAHAGSTTLVYDANGDGKLDMLIGDVTCSNMNLVINGNTNQTPIMTSAIQEYPTAHPIDIELFPAAFFNDINNDGLKDLIISTNMTNATMNTNHVQLYMNNGQTTLDRFEFQTDNFFLSDMIDVSEGSAPAFVDYNNDGLMDIVISNAGYWVNSSTTKTGLALYQNIGSKSLAKYELVSRDWLGFSSLNIANMCPSFGDMDNDGDMDMVCGSNDGTLHYFQNIANAGTNMNLQYVSNYFNGIDVGNFSSPFIYDLNNDNKKEIIVGERFDNVNLIENIGTVTNPNFKISTDSLYKLNMKMFGTYPSGRSHVQIHQLRPNDAPRVIISNGNSKIYIMDEVSSDYAQRMKVATDSLDLHAGMFSASNGGFCFSMADINDDSKPEIIVGNPQGGLFLYRNNSLSVGIDNLKAFKELKVYPNPSSTFVNIQTSDLESIDQIKILDINAKLLSEVEFNSRTIQLDLSAYSNGIYFIQAKTKNTIYTSKISIIK